MVWKFLDTGARTAFENMSIDSTLLSDLEKFPHPVLHFYDWQNDAATYGHFIDPEKFLNFERIKTRNLDLAKRPTGGGIVFHNCDLAFSVLIPSSHPDFSLNPLDNYAFVNKRVIWVLKQIESSEIDLLPKEPKLTDLHIRSFCMAKPTKYDVMIGGKKVGGAAQRKTRHGFLHQGSISLGFLSEDYLRSVLALESQVLEAMRHNSFAFLKDGWTKKDLEEMRAVLRNLLKIAFSDDFN